MAQHDIVLTYVPFGTGAGRLGQDIQTSSVAATHTPVISGMKRRRRCHLRPPSIC